MFSFSANDIRGRRNWESSNAELGTVRNYYTDKNDVNAHETFNLNMGDWEFPQFSKSVSFGAEFFVRFGFSASSWCIVMLPDKFKVDEDETTIAGTNLTHIWTYELTVGSLGKR